MSNFKMEDYQNNIEESKSNPSSEDEFFDARSESCEKLLEHDFSETNQTDKLIKNESNENSFSSASTTNEFVQPKPPPRLKKKNKYIQKNKFESIQNEKINLTSFVDDIASIQGDLSVTEACATNSDRKSVYADDEKKRDLNDDLITKVVEENLVKTNKNSYKELKESLKSITSNEEKSSIDKSKDNYEFASKRPSKGNLIDNNVSKCINPINLHLLKIMNEYQSDEEDFDNSSTTTDTLINNVENIIDEQDLNAQPNKKEPLKSTVKNLKKIGQGLMKSVRNVRSSKDFTLDIKQQLIPETDQQSIYKFKSNRKKDAADFEGLKLIQEINDCCGAIWCMKWSVCGKLLAVAGQDQLLRVYCCLSVWKYFTQLRNNASRNSSSRNNSISSNDNISYESVLRNTSKNYSEDNTLSEEGALLLFSVYNGHTADVLDLAWSKNHFLLSSSMDRTVLLWHVTRIECLCIFRHSDFVTTINFHPRDDRYFLSGSLDGKVRLWNIIDKKVTLWNEVPLPVQNNRNKNHHSSLPSYGLITASAFVQNGKFVVVGTYDGRVIFYTTDQLKYFTILHVGSDKQFSKRADPTIDRGKPKQHYKITGIEGLDENKILVTTNDSRIRLYDLRDLSLACKYKGHINVSSQIKASVSHDSKYIVCGSENSSFYIWKLQQDNTSIGQRRDRNSQWESIRLLPNSSLSSFQNYTNSAIGTSNIANKNNVPGIITAATFATIPNLLDENAKYVIVVADFSGVIRIFSK